MIIEKSAKSAIYDENKNIIRFANVGSGCYGNAMFACSKCGKTYATLGGLRLFHQMCNQTNKSTKGLSA